jgi:hypothetical protein
MHETRTALREGKGLIKILMGKPEVMRPLRTPTREYKDSIKMKIKQMMLDDVKWFLRFAPCRIGNYFLILNKLKYAYAITILFVCLRFPPFPPVNF